MKKALNQFLSIVIYVSAGIFMGIAFAEYQNYQRYHLLYDAANSAPWQVRLLVPGILVIAVIGLCIFFKLQLKKPKEAKD